ncbi:hypothetical protein [Saccharococcus sp. Marseille-Q5394]|uniref:hypothetical protein n=1 Tax=Saccharococcus sp. Marseille-Q5394 TaxID=2972778 RepID=UPI0021C8F586|nr:hypothetical protein [Saccharococcus sp. Marseille-Q5394]
MAKIIPFKTKQQIEAEKAKKTIREWENYLEWEEAKWHNVINRAEDITDLSKEEMDWLNDWLEKNDN